MGETTSQKVPFKVSSDKTLRKLLPGDKTLGHETDIRLYTLEDGNETV